MISLDRGCYFSRRSKTRNSRQRAVIVTKLFQSAKVSRFLLGVLPLFFASLRILGAKAVC